MALQAGHTVPALIMKKCKPPEFCQNNLYPSRLVKTSSENHHPHLPVLNNVWCMVFNAINTLTE